METNNLLSAVFGCLAAYFIFNLSYHPKTGDFWVFVQEKIGNIPSKSYKKHPSTSCHFAGITRFVSGDRDESMNDGHDSSDDNISTAY